MGILNTVKRLSEKLNVDIDMKDSVIKVKYVAKGDKPYAGMDEESFNAEIKKLNKKLREWGLEELKPIHHYKN